MHILQTPHIHQLSFLPQTHSSPGLHISGKSRQATTGHTPGTVPASSLLGPSPIIPCPDFPCPIPWAHHPSSDPALLSGLQPHPPACVSHTDSLAPESCSQGSWDLDGGMRKASWWEEGRAGAEPEQKVLTLEHSRGSQSPLTKTGKARRPGEETKRGQPVRLLLKLHPHPSSPEPHDPQPRPPADPWDPVWPAGKVLR